jgi:hypothetical protein
MLEYSEKLLDENAQTRIDEHLQECSMCAQELSDIEYTLDLLQSVPFPEPPESFWTDFTSAVMIRINRMETPSSKRWQVFSFPRFKTAVVLLVLIVILGGVYVYFNTEIQQFLHPVDTTAKLPGQGETLQRASDLYETDGVIQDDALETTLNNIASKDLMQDMLESDLALFDGAPDVIIEMDYSDDMLYSLINSLTEEEKKAFLSELYKMRDETR